MIQISEKPENNREIIEKSIKKYGYTPDHNFDWFINFNDIGNPKAALDKEYVIFCYFNNQKNIWAICSDPIAPQKIKIEFLANLINYLLSKNPNKIFFLDVREEIKKFCEQKYKNLYIFNYELIWPILNMKKFDPLLGGSHLKSIRNAKNKFYKEHNIEILPVKSVEKNGLHHIVEMWHKQRLNAGIEELYANKYHNLINNNFSGCKSARVMKADNKLVGFNAGWDTPNTPGDYSAVVGIHDFTIKDLGVVLLLEDLEWIKKAGYKTCDLGGSEEGGPLKFKMQFRPERIYKTYSFILHVAPSM